ncbi:MAG: SDR family oxidoreductase [Myxococcota bacterium]
MRALVQGASRGIGLELVRQLLARGDEVIATCRAPEKSEPLQSLQGPTLQLLELDLEDEESIAAAAANVNGELDLLMNVAGLLHDGAVQPEKKLGHVEPDALHRVFAVNAFGPLLVAKHFGKLLLHRRPAVLANLSARVGSIGDNRLGGWYAYRASKAALNMFTANLAIELGRRSAALSVIALHPGTVKTDLSAPFRKRVPEDRLFEVSRAAAQLLAITDRVGPEDTGRFFAWDGSSIPW